MTSLNLLLCTIILIFTGAVSLYVYRHSTLKWLMPAAFVVWLGIGIFTARSTYEGEEAVQHLTQMQQSETIFPMGAENIRVVEWNFVRGCLFGGLGCFLSAGLIYFVNGEKIHSTITSSEPRDLGPDI